MTAIQKDKPRVVAGRRIIGYLAVNIKDQRVLDAFGAPAVFRTKTSAFSWIEEHDVPGKWTVFPLRYVDLQRSLHSEGMPYFLDHASNERFSRAEWEWLPLYPSLS